MKEIVDADDLFTVEWDGCDLVVETTLFFDAFCQDDHRNQKFVEMVAVDRLCVADMEHYGAVRFQFIATTEA